MSDIEERFAALESRVAQLEAQRLQSLGMIHGVSVILKMEWQREWFATGAVYQAHADRLTQIFIDDIEAEKVSIPDLTSEETETVREYARGIARDMANMMVNQFDAYDGPPSTQST